MLIEIPFRFFWKAYNNIYKWEFILVDTNILDYTDIAVFIFKRGPLD